MKLFENVEIKNLISIVSMVVFLGINVFGCVIGKFEDVFEFDKQIITVVVSFFLGSKLGGTTEKNAFVEAETVPQTSENEDYE